MSGLCSRVSHNSNSGSGGTHRLVLRQRRTCVRICCRRNTLRLSRRKDPGHEKCKESRYREPSHGGEVEAHHPVLARSTALEATPRAGGNTFSSSTMFELVEIHRSRGTSPSQTLEKPVGPRSAPQDSALRGIALHCGVKGSPSRMRMTQPLVSNTRFPSSGREAFILSTRIQFQGLALWAWHLRSFGKMP